MRPGPRPRHDASRFCGPSLALPARSPLRRLSGLKRLGRSGVAQTASGTGRRAACRVQASRRGDTRACAPRRLRALRCPSCPQGPEPGLADPRRATTGTPPCHSRLRLLAMMAGIRSGCSADRIVTELGSGIGLPVRIRFILLTFTSGSQFLAISSPARDIFFRTLRCTDVCMLFPNSRGFFLSDSINQKTQCIPQQKSSGLKFHCMNLTATYCVNWSGLVEILRCSINPSSIFQAFSLLRFN